jgi:NAD(P)-dependent dehydrogenase (short-subunit alcohol dehydrogenase family)
MEDARSPTSCHDAVRSSVRRDAIHQEGWDVVTNDVRRAFVSGGTGDIGADIVRGLAADGYAVHFQYHGNGELASALAKSTGAVPFHSDYSAVDRADDDELVPDKDGFDVLVCCAGVNLDRDLVADTPPEILRRTLDVNVLSAFRLTQACLPRMVSRGWGRIVYINSVFGQIAAPLNCAYNITKSALHGLCHSVVADYPGSSITANQVVAGPVDSSMFSELTAERARRIDRQHEVLVAGTVRRIPARRLGTPADVRHAVDFLVSDAAAYITGSSLRVDGGMLSIL